jgi:hypothetical protein
VKTALKGKRFHDAEDMKIHLRAELNTVPVEVFSD